MCFNSKQLKKLVRALGSFINLLLCNENNYYVFLEIVKYNIFLNIHKELQCTQYDK